MEQITIAGKVFNAPLRYEEGHELSASEALALNQTYHENLRNNFAKRVKGALANGGFDQSALQAEFDALAQNYQFGVRTSGKRAGRDPVMKEAIDIARGKIKEALKAKGQRAEDAAVTRAAKKLIANNPAIMDLARQRVAQAQAVAASDLEEIISDIAA